MFMPDEVNAAMELLRQRDTNSERPSSSLAAEWRRRTTAGAARGAFHWIICCWI
jgi:hypothetical protein